MKVCGMNILEYIEAMMEAGYSEEDAETLADYEFSLDREDGLEDVESEVYFL